MFDNLWDEMTRPFDLWEDGLTSAVRGVSADVYETDSEVVVKMAVPGINPDDLAINISGDTVQISGETQDEKEDQGKTYYQRQLRYGRFAQSVVLPTPVDADKAEATFRNGMLTLTLPKTESARPKQIKVRVEDQVNKLKAK